MTQRQKIRKEKQDLARCLGINMGLRVEIRDLRNIIEAQTKGTLVWEKDRFDGGRWVYSR